MSTELIESLVAKARPLLSPISATEPAGKDVSLEPDFDRVRTEVDKLTSMAGDPPNWELVVDTGRKLLAEQTKDMKLVTWIAVALMWQHGFAGLAEGLVLCREAMREFWDTMLPPVKRVRPRANLFGWFCDGIIGFAETREVGRVDIAPLAVCETAFADLDALLRDKLGEAYPANRVKSTLKAKVQQIPPPTPPPPPPAPEPPPPPEPAAAAAAPAASTANAGNEAMLAPPPPPAPAPSAAAPPLPPPVAPPRQTSRPTLPTNAKDASDAVQACAEILFKAAAVLHDADPTDAFSYRLRRLAAFMALGDRAMVAAPPQGALAEVARLVAQGSFIEAVKAAERAIERSPQSLDLNRHVIVALEKLGAPFAGARSAVEGDVRAILARDPGAIERVFEDGSHAAEGMTRAWALAQRRRAAPASDLLAEEDAELVRRVHEVRDAIRNGHAGEGIGLAIGLARRAPYARGRFLIQLDACRTAVEVGKHSLARPVLEVLLEDVERHGLDTWEPELCATLYSALLQCFRAEGAGGGGQRAATLYDKLYRIDPIEALRHARD